jgi:hypothetical protein
MTGLKYVGRKYDSRWFDIWTKENSNKNKDISIEINKKYATTEDNLDWLLEHRAY